MLPIQEIVIMLKKKIVYRLLPMAIVLALFFIVIAEPAASDQESDDAKVLRQFGEQIVKNNPSLASASNLEKAKAGFVEYLKKLSASNAGVSNDVWGRISDKLFADERTAFTCSVHTFNLQDIFAGMGIDSQSIGQIGGEMDTYNPLNVNSDHGAVLIRDNDGKEYVFDAWAHATMRDTLSPLDDLYGEGETSPFNGMPKNEWTDQMKEEGYTTFFEDGFLADPIPAIVEESDSNGCTEFKVPPTAWAGESWFNTGISILSGQNISIVATGTVQPNSGSISCGPDGTYEVDYWLTDYSYRSDWGHESLIAGIGAEGLPIFIGSNATFTAPEGGELWLGVNDKDPGNNAGQYVAKVCWGDDQ